MSYISGFVVPVSTSKREDYRVYAERAVPIFKKHGALSVMECWGETVPDGKVTSFPMAVKLQEGETVVFSWIVWPSKEVCDAAMQKIMDEPAFDPKDNPWPFDGQRMIHGGFVPLVEA